MMWYSIIGEDVPEKPGKRLSARPAHVERLQGAAGRGRLLLAGPFPAIDSMEPGPAGFSVA